MYSMYQCWLAPALEECKDLWRAQQGWPCKVFHWDALPLTLFINLPIAYRVECLCFLYYRVGWHAGNCIFPQKKIGFDTYGLCKCGTETLTQGWELGRVYHWIKGALSDDPLLWFQSAKCQSNSRTLSLKLITVLAKDLILVQVKLY